MGIVSGQRPRREFSLFSSRFRGTLQFRPSMARDSLTGDADPLGLI